MANKWKKVIKCKKYMEGIFFSEEIDSLSNVLERDHLVAVAAKKWLREVERQTANETSEQTEDREHVSRDHVGRDHDDSRPLIVWRGVRLKLFTSRHRQGPSAICFCSVQ